MSKLNLKIPCLAIALVFASCHRNDTTKDSVETVKINLDTEKSLSVDAGTIIPLETNDSSLIYNIWNLILVNDTLVIHSRDLVKSFDANDGRFQNSLVKKGQASGEVTTVSEIWQEGGTVCVFDFNGRKLLRISPEGKLLSENMPLISKSPAKEEYASPIFLLPSTDGDGYICLNSFTDGTTDRNPAASVYDKDFKFVKNIEGREMKEAVYLSNRMTPDIKNNRMLLWEPYRDTLYSVTKEKIEPIFAFDFGKNAFPPEYQAYDEMYDRYQKFNEERDTPYASLLQCYQTWGDLVVFLFSTSDKTNHLAVLDTSDNQITTYRLADDSGKYVMGRYLKIAGNYAYISLTDQETEDNNPALLKIPVSTLKAE